MYKFRFILKDDNGTNQWNTYFYSKEKMDSTFNELYEHLKKQEKLLLVSNVVRNDNIIMYKCFNEDFYITKIICEEW